MGADRYLENVMGGEVARKMAALVAENARLRAVADAVRALANSSALEEGYRNSRAAGADEAPWEALADALEALDED